VKEVADDYIHARIPSEWKKEIQDLIRQGIYKDQTDFLHRAIENELCPDVQTKRIKDRMIALAKYDPHVRKEFKLD
jgi:Arc/MetJ-type ribon-helix-helix transcriptional regulator